MANATIIERGTIVSATKLPVITIGIGKVKDLRDLEGVVWHEENGNVIIKTKEAPTGCVYFQDRTAVVRIIGGQVKIGGMYDIYAPDDSKIEKLLSRPFDLNTLTEEQKDELQPILNIGNDIRPSLAPAETGRKVIVITDEVLDGAESIQCHCPWDPEDVFTSLYKGDIFLVQDENTDKGYRIGKEEFEGTHMLD